MTFASANFTALELNHLVKIIGGEKNVRSLLNGTLKFALTEKISKAVKKAFDQIGGLVTIAPSQKQFIAKDEFVSSSDFPISYMGSNFKKCFLGKVEPAFTGSTLKEENSENNFRDSTFFHHLGEGDENVGEQKAETTLFEMKDFLKKEKKLSYVFYIKDSEGILRAVNASRDDVGWRFFAYEVRHPVVWGANNCVVSRNFESK